LAAAIRKSLQSKTLLQRQIRLTINGLPVVNGQLVQISVNGRLKLTEDGLRRLKEKGDCLPTAQKYNPFSPEAAQPTPSIRRR
jgi:hypothetical protein